MQFTGAALQRRRSISQVPEREQEQGKHNIIPGFSTNLLVVYVVLRTAVLVIRGVQSVYTLTRPSSHHHNTTCLLEQKVIAWLS